MTITELTKKCYELAKEKGFWDKERNFAEMIALTHSELSECLEAHRKGRDMYKEGREPSEIYYGQFPPTIETKYNTIVANYTYSIINLLGEDIEQTLLKDIKDCYELELADAIIRILDICGGLNIPIEELILAKLEYNNNRPYKHGKQY